MKNWRNSDSVLVSVAIHTFNDEQTVGMVVERACGVLEELGLTYEVIVVDDGSDVLAGVSGIHLGEAEAVLLAQKLGTELIVDEGEASTTAQMFGVRPIGTIAVLVLALSNRTYPTHALWKRNNVACACD
jgi:hypothetical protein